MTYFETDVKIKVIDMKVSVPMNLKSLELDPPRRSSKLLKLREFCRSRNQKSAADWCTILKGKTVEMGYAIKRRVEDPCVRFLTTPHSLKLDQCIEIYVWMTEVSSGLGTNDMQQYYARIWYGRRLNWVLQSKEELNFCELAFQRYLTRPLWICVTKIMVERQKVG